MVAQNPNDDDDRASWRTVLRASVTPLASIFGSGFLIIVPVLERTVGPYAAFGAAGICLLAYFVGSAIRVIVRDVEPLAESGDLNRTSERLERISDFLIVVAYVISVALYLRIMAQYILGYVGPDTDVAERALASGAILGITIVGVVRGFSGLEMLERVALVAVLFLVTILGGAFFFSDLGQVLGNGPTLPAAPDKGIAKIFLVLGGALITVQGFETVRYIGDAYDAPTRIRASRVSQFVSASIYVGFAAVCTPLMGLAVGAGPDKDLLDITERVVPLLTLPLVICAVLSQFSAATADTVAAAGNLHSLFRNAMRGPRPYVFGGAVAIVLAWTIPTFTIIAVASRAFAAYYAVQCVVAARASGGAARAGFWALALVMALITLLAEPAA